MGAADMGAGSATAATAERSQTDTWMEYWNSLQAGAVPAGGQQGPQGDGGSASGASSTPMGAATAGPSLPDPEEPFATAASTDAG